MNIQSNRIINKRILTFQQEKENVQSVIQRTNEIVTVKHVNVSVAWQQHQSYAFLKQFLSNSLFFMSHIIRGHMMLTWTCIFIFGNTWTAAVMYTQWKSTCFQFSSVSALGILFNIICNL